MSKKAKTAKLSDEQIAQIADRVGNQLKQGTPSNSGTYLDKNNKGRKGAYFWGALSGMGLILVAPALRPAMRGAVKGGIVAGRYAKKVASNMKEEFEDMTAEAQAELDRENNKADNHVNPA